MFLPFVLINSFRHIRTDESRSYCIDCYFLLGNFLCQCFGMGYLLIKSGLQDCILCGGAQEVNPYAVGSFDGLSAFSTQEAAPEKASKPFDKRRDGLIPSGGAASLVLRVMNRL